MVSPFLVFQVPSRWIGYWRYPRGTLSRLDCARFDSPPPTDSHEIGHPRTWNTLAFPLRRAWVSSLLSKSRKDILWRRLCFVEGAKGEERTFHLTSTLWFGDDRPCSRCDRRPNMQTTWANYNDQYSTFTGNAKEWLPPIRWSRARKLVDLLHSHESGSVVVNRFEDTTDIIQIEIVHRPVLLT